VKAPDRLNRLALLALGLVLFAAGAYGLARSYGALGDTKADEPVLLESVRTFVGRHDAWFWPVSFVVALLIAYLGYRWLKAQLVPGGRRPKYHVADARDEVVLTAAALEDAVASDLEEDHRVIAANARITEFGDTPALNVTMTVRDDVTFHELKHDYETRNLERARSALDASQIRSKVIVAFSGRPDRHLT
jgi:hypothetical protein